ncbi:hypothetical protein BGZ95_012015 [Linnemannia exigua]|uniref:Uncharacterized protein n=1 Tax=Linnemannia exigua TaxID=604196 RepID=A0AAD4D940_9FUNG|nr:hypothetical protein BGZ95_012015 [Linnemannia exigua]
MSQQVQRGRGRGGQWTYLQNPTGAGPFGRRAQNRQNKRARNGEEVAAAFAGAPVASASPSISAITTARSNEVHQQQRQVVKGISNSSINTDSFALSNNNADPQKNNDNSTIIPNTSSSNSGQNTCATATTATIVKDIIATSTASNIIVTATSRDFNATTAAKNTNISTSNILLAKLARPIKNTDTLIATTAISTATARNTSVSTTAGDTDTNTKAPMADLARINSNNTPTVNPIRSNNYIRTLTARNTITNISTNSLVANLERYNVSHPNMNTPMVNPARSINTSTIKIINNSKPLSIQTQQILDTTNIMTLAVNDPATYKNLLKNKPLDASTTLENNYTFTTISDGVVYDFDPRMPMDTLMELVGKECEEDQALVESFKYGGGGKK